MPFTVNRYEDPQTLFDETGINAVVCVDENTLQLELETGDEVITNGGMYSVIKGGFPADTQVLGRGAGYTVIIETP